MDSFPPTASEFEKVALLMLVLSAVAIDTRFMLPGVGLAPAGRP